jgi:demethylmenaquinone methyltransferase/2-methoxy-6-polyprenyl-1,4-benzoquinol methylase
MTVDTEPTKHGTHRDRPIPPSRREAWKMFDRIAHRYDLLNRLLSFGQDSIWRRRVARLLPDGSDLHLLDLATGTADLLLSLKRRSARVEFGVGLDMAARMLAIGRQKITRTNQTGKLTLVRSDACRLPFDDSTFSAVTIAFGIRNVIDIPLALREMHRVLKPNGRTLILEFSLPENRFIRRIYLLYFRRVLPAIGGLISGDSLAYHYLNETVETFPYGQDFCRLMEDADFANVKANRLTLGVATIYQGDRPVERA